MLAGSRRQLREHSLAGMWHRQYRAAERLEKAEQLLFGVQYGGAPGSLDQCHRAVDSARLDLIVANTELGKQLEASADCAAWRKRRAAREDLVKKRMESVEARRRKKSSLREIKVVLGPMPATTRSSPFVVMQESVVNVSSFFSIFSSKKKKKRPVSLAKELPKDRPWSIGPVAPIHKSSSADQAKLRPHAFSVSDHDSLMSMGSLSDEEAPKMASMRTLKMQAGVMPVDDIATPSPVDKHAALRAAHKARVEARRAELAKKRAPHPPSSAAAPKTNGTTGHAPQPPPPPPPPSVAVVNPDSATLSPESDAAPGRRHSPPPPPPTSDEGPRRRPSRLGIRKGFVDAEFPADEASIGPVGAGSQLASLDVRWMDADDIVRDEGGSSVELFRDDQPQPSDIQQGMLGTCYFLSSLMALCEHSDVVRGLFDGSLNPHLELHDHVMMMFDNLDVDGNGALLKTQLVNHISRVGFLSRKQVAKLDAALRKVKTTMIKRDEVVKAARGALHEPPTKTGNGGMVYDGVAGKATVQLCIAGKWVPVTISDEFPCFTSPATGQPQPAFSHFKPQAKDAAKAPSAIWVMCLEKAFAKVNGNYARIEGGDPAAALFDLTGCPTFRVGLNGNPKHPMKHDPEFAWAEIESRHKTGAVLCACMPLFVQEDGKAVSGEHEAECGLVHGHAYAVIDMATVDGEHLVRFRNPWGRGEWTGKWSDSWPGWNAALHAKVRSLSSASNGSAATTGVRRQSMSVDVVADDGMFWMSWTDVCRHFAHFEGCDVESAPGKGWHHDAVTLDFDQHQTAAIVEVRVGFGKGGDTFLMACQRDVRMDPNLESTVKYIDGTTAYTGLQVSLISLGAAGEATAGKMASLAEKPNVHVVTTPMCATRTFLVGCRATPFSIPNPLKLKPGRYMAIVERSPKAAATGPLQLNLMSCSEKGVELFGRSQMATNQPQPRSPRERDSVAKGNDVTRRLFADLVSFCATNGEQQILCDQVSPAFVRWNFSCAFATMMLFGVADVGSKGPKGYTAVITVTVQSSTKDNIVVQAPPEATVSVPSGKASVVCEITMRVSAKTPKENAFVLVARKAPGRYACGFGMSVKLEPPVRKR